MAKTKKRDQKALEYEQKFGDIPKDYLERCNWLYDELNITETKADSIIDKYKRMQQEMCYTELTVPRSRCTMRMTMLLCG